MKDDVVAAVTVFFAEGRMPEGVNDTAIVLIPKVAHPEQVVSKYLVNRLRPLLDELVSENQSVFVPGRLIADNVLIAFECLRAI